jgi:uncharacterized membrane protein YwaF
MQVIVNAFLLVAAYRFCYVLERKGAVIWGAITGLVLTGVSWLFAPGEMRPSHLLVVALAEVAVLAASFYLCTRREGLLVTVLNLTVSSVSALLLPYLLPGWLGL